MLIEDPDEKKARESQSQQGSFGQQQRTDGGMLSILVLYMQISYIIAISINIFVSPLAL